MDETLKAGFSDAERAHAAALFDGEDPDLKQAIINLFADLSDPLLSADDIKALLATRTRKAKLKSILDELVANGDLEASIKTQRPFDPDGVALYRKALPEPGKLRLLALESIDDSGRHRFLFTLDGRLIRSFARVARLNALDNEGNQRNEIKKHVKAIAKGIAGGTPVPNPVLLVLLEEVTEIIDGYGTDEDDEDSIPQSFIKIRPYFSDVDWIDVDHSDSQVQKVRLSTIEIPFRRAAFDDEKSILLVDGQQRTSALSLVPVDKMPTIEMAVNAVIADAEEAKHIFQVANNTVKISTEFSAALLAAIETPPGYLKREKAIADACKILALEDASSPFYFKVKHPGAKVPKATIVYNSLFAVVSKFAENLPDSIVGKPEDLASLVSRCFGVIRSTWPGAWDEKPSDSRLVHGAGLRAMASLAVSKVTGFLERNWDLGDAETWKAFGESMSRLKQRVIWTDAEAAAGTKTQKKLFRDEIAARQNTVQDIKALTDFLRKESLDLDMQARPSGGVSAG